MRHFACSEVFLGLFPAWGGTQLTPRLVGPEIAARLIVLNPLRQNKLLKADEAVELGLADKLLEPVEFVDESLQLAVELASTRQAGQVHLYKRDKCDKLRFPDSSNTKYN